MQLLTLSSSFWISLYFLLRSNFSFGTVCCNLVRWFSAVRNFFSASLHSVWYVWYVFIVVCNSCNTRSISSCVSYPISRHYTRWCERKTKGNNLSFYCHDLSLAPLFRETNNSPSDISFEHPHTLSAIVLPNVSNIFLTMQRDPSTMILSDWPTVASMCTMKIVAIVHV